MAITKKKKDEQATNGVAQSTPIEKPSQKQESPKVDINTYYNSTHNADGTQKVIGTPKKETTNPNYVSGFHKSNELPSLEKVEEVQRKRGTSVAPEQSMVDKWLANDYQMTAEDKKQAKEYLRESGYHPSKSRYEMSDTDFARLNNLDLKANWNPVSEALTGLVQGAIPGYEYLADKFGTDDRNAYIDSLMDDYKGAGLTGRLAGEAAKYAATRWFLGLIPGLNTIPGTVGKGAEALLGGKINPAVANQLGRSLANASLDLGTDVLLDTIPSELSNYNNGMRGQELLDDTAKNVLTNMLFNAGAEGLSYLPGLSSNNAIKNATMSDYFKSAKNSIEDSARESLENIIKNEVEIPTNATEQVVTDALKNLETQNTAEPVAKQIADELSSQPTSLSDLMNKFNTEQAIERRIAEETGAMPSDISSLMKEYDKAYPGRNVKVPTNPLDGYDTSMTFDNNFLRSLNDYATPNRPAINEPIEIPSLSNFEDIINKGNTSFDNFVKAMERMGFDDDEIYAGIKSEYSKEIADAWANSKTTQNVAESIGADVPKTVSTTSEVLPKNDQSLIEPNNIPTANPSAVNEADSYINKIGESGVPSNKQSEFYTNTTQKTTSPEFYSKNIEDVAKTDTVNTKSDLWKNDIATRRIAEEGADVWANRLLNAENIVAEDVTTIKKLTEIYDQTNPDMSVKLRRALRPHMTNSAQVLQAAAEWGKTNPEINLEVGLAMARRTTDGIVKKPGFSDAVNNAADKIQNAIENGNFEEAKKLAKEKLSTFAVGENAKNVLDETTLEGEQMILDLIGGYTPDKKSLKELAEEVSSEMRKLNGVADFSVADERAILSLLEQMENYEKGTRQYKELQAMAAEYIDSKIPTKAGEKFKTFLYDNMLGNFRTAVSRNFGGNAIANSLEKSQKPLKVAVDKATSLVTGKRNYVLDSKVSDAYFEGFKKGWKDQIADIKNHIDTTRSGEEEFINALNNVHRAYKGDSNFSKALNGYDKVVKRAMQLGDRPFYEAEYAATKEELGIIVDKLGKNALQRAGVPSDALKNTDSLIEFWARQRALEACFQNGSLSANALKQFKAGLGMLSQETIGADVLSQGTLPFTQVAGNMFGRYTDYIPVFGTAKNIINTVGEASHDNFNQKRFVDATSRNMVGLGLLGGGYGMAKNVDNGGKFGITGAYSEDSDERAAQQNSGYQEYSLQVPWGKGVKQVNLDDIPVIGPSMESSVRFYEGVRDNPDNKTEGIYKGLQGAISSSLQNAMLQNLNRITGQNSYGSGDIGENLLQIVASLPSQGIPSLARQATQVIDPYKRDLGQYGTLDYALNSVVNSTPARMFALNPKLDAEGNEVLQNQGRGTGSKILENMVLPWTVTEPQYSNLTSLAQDIKANSTDNTSKAFATVPSRSTVRGWLGDDYSEEEYYNVKGAVGELNRRLGNRISNSPNFDQLSPDEQGIAMSKIYTTAEGIVRAQKDPSFTYDDGMSDSIKKYTDYINEYGEYEGQQKYVDDIIRDGYLNTQNLPANKVTKAIYDNGDVDKLNKYKQALDKAEEYGYDSISESEWKDYDKLGTQVFNKDMRTKQTLDSYDLDNNQTVRNLYDKYGESELPTIKQAADDIESIVTGTDKWGDETFQSLTEKSYDIWKDKGKGGVQTYVNMVGYDANNDGRISLYDDTLPFLIQSDMSDADKGYYLSKKQKPMNAAQNAEKDYGDAGVYKAYLIKWEVQSKYNSVSQKHLRAYLDGTNMSYSEKAKWFHYFYPDKNY